MAADRLLVRGRFVVPDADLPAVEDGAVLVDGDRVAAVGPADELGPRAAGARVLGSADHLVVPGFVNAHSHGRGVTAFQLGVLDDQLELWLLDRRAQRPVDAHWDAQLAAIRLLQSGVTSVLHNHVTRDVRRYEAELDETLAAYATVGLRVAFAPEIRHRWSFVYDEDAAFLQRLPPPLRAELSRHVAGVEPVRLARYLAAVDGLARRVGVRGARHRLLYGPMALQWIGDEDMRAIADEAGARGLGLHVHVQESPYQREWGPRAYGHSIVRQLDRLGALGPRTTLAHCVWLSEDDLEVLARTGTSYAHNPSSNLRLKSGISPVVPARARGVTVALGTDSMTLNDDEDFVQEMRLAAKLHRLPGMDAAALSSRDVLRMATRDGRAAVLCEDVGSLQPGAAADLVLLRLGGLLDPLQEPGFDPVDLLLYRARREHVDTVLVGGEVVLEGGRPTRTDEAAVLAALRADRERAASWRPSGPTSGSTTRRGVGRARRPTTTTTAVPEGSGTRGESRAMGQAEASNWGRWGADDQVGALNLMTPARIVDAVRLVRFGRLYNLAVPLDKDGPQFPTFHKTWCVTHFTRATAPRAVNFADDVVTMETHSGTHLDALGHVWRDGTMWNGRSADAVTSYGVEWGGVHLVPGIVGRGVLLDIARFLGVANLGLGDVVTVDMMEACARAEGIEIRPGDVLLLRTGWYTVFQRDRELWSQGEPGPDASCTAWLKTKDVIAVGADTPAVEGYVYRDRERLAERLHVTALRDLGVYLIENLDLEALGRDQVYECLFVAAPLRLTRATGAPMAPLALA
jgi:5-methylthioadenosine/S-adenosylhomocysteine deaminase